MAPVFGTDGTPISHVYTKKQLISSTSFFALMFASVCNRKSGRCCKPRGEIEAVWWPHIRRC